MVLVKKVAVMSFLLKFDRNKSIKVKIRVNYKFYYVHLINNLLKWKK